MRMLEEIMTWLVLQLGFPALNDAIMLNKSFNRFVKLRASVLKLEVRRVKPSSRFQTVLTVHP